jgi:diketogulonate reductase-like aldo/keto reductase
MIIHSPPPWAEFGGADRHFEGNREAWRAMEAAYEAGKLRAIGVSNFERADLDNLLDGASVKPMVNQILAHVSNTPFELIDYSRGKGLLVEAYSYHPSATARSSTTPTSARWRRRTASACPSSASATCCSSACCRCQRRRTRTT